MNGTERELRTVPFSFSNCDSVNDKFLHTCKGINAFHYILFVPVVKILGCQMEILFNTTWPQSYVNTSLMLPCMISEGK